MIETTRDAPEGERHLSPLKEFMDEKPRLNGKAVASIMASFIGVISLQTMVLLAYIDNVSENMGAIASAVASNSARISMKADKTDTSERWRRTEHDEYAKRRDAELRSLEERLKRLEKN